MTGPHAYPRLGQRDGPQNHEGEWRSGRQRISRMVVGVAPYAMLAFAVALTPLLDDAGRRSVLVAVGVSGLVAAWMLWMYTLHPTWRSRPRRMGVFIVVLLLLMTILVLGYPWFGFFSFTAYFYLFTLVPARRPRMAGVVTVAVLAGTSQAGGIAHAAANRKLTASLALLHGRRDRP